MKKLIFFFAFIIGSAIFGGIFLGCVLQLLGIIMGISIDGLAVARQYPRLIPFCLVVGLLAVIFLALVFILGIIASQKIGISKNIWLWQIITAVFLSLPVIKLWEMAVEFLQKTF